MIDAQVHDDPIQPGEELRVAGKALEVLVHLEKRLLADVARVVMVVHHSEGHGIRPALVTNHQLAKRGRIAPAGLVDEPLFVRVHTGSVSPLARKTRGVRDYSARFQGRTEACGGKNERRSEE